MGGQFPGSLDCKVFGWKEHCVSYLSFKWFVFCIIIGFLVLLCFLHFFKHFECSFGFFFQVKVHLLCIIMQLHFILFILMSLWFQVALCHQMGLQVHDWKAEELPTYIVYKRVNSQCSGQLCNLLQILCIVVHLNILKEVCYKCAHIRFVQICGWYIHFAPHSEGEMQWRHWF